MCGCPLEADFPSVLSESKSYCRNLKKSCFKHFAWEKLRRAEIDQEKLNLVCHAVYNDVGVTTDLYVIAIYGETKQVLYDARFCYATTCVRDI